MYEVGKLESNEDCQLVAKLLNKWYTGLYHFYSNGRCLRVSYLTVEPPISIDELLEILETMYHTALCMVFAVKQ